MSRQAKINSIFAIIIVSLLVLQLLDKYFTSNIDVNKKDKVDVTLSIDSIVSAKEREYRNKLDSVNKIHKKEIDRLNIVIHDLKRKRTDYDDKLGVWPEF